MSNYTSGHKAEKVAADYLKSLGFNIRELNWKTRWCEIDIITDKDKTVHFVEVKYRKTSAQGDGFDYITPKKLQQMRFAAELWVSQHGWTGEYVLSAVQVSGEDYTVTAWLDSI